MYRHVRALVFFYLFHALSLINYEVDEDSLSLSFLRTHFYLKFGEQHLIN